MTILPGSLVPQADNLARVRTVLAAVASGHTTRTAISTAIDVSERHVAYALLAAESLGLLDTTAMRPTERGERLLRTAVGGADERASLREAIEASRAVREIAPDLFAAETPSRATLAKRIIERSELGEATSDRRAGTLLAWRTHILGLEPTHDASQAAGGAEPEHVTDEPPPVSEEPSPQLGLPF